MRTILMIKGFVEMPELFQSITDSIYFYYSILTYIVQLVSSFNRIWLKTILLKVGRKRNFTFFVVL